MAAAAMPKTMPPDWANLHEELLAFTAMKLTNAIHFVRFRAVCRRWRSAARPADLPPQTPWLILANLKEGGDTSSFFCPVSIERFSLNLPSAIPAKSVLGSSHGWLVLCDYKVDPEHLCLLNPLTASRIPLPPLEVGPSRPSYASLSSDPAGGGRRCIVMVTFLRSTEFVFCRPGDAIWTRVNIGVNIGSHRRPPASAYHKGSFYIVDSRGGTAICGLSPADEVTHIPAVCGSPTDCYLVESADGEDLFLVTARYYAERKFFKLDLKTELFELDKSAAQTVWSKIDGIGGNAIFLSGHSCCCVKPSDFSGCRKNTLYFTQKDFASVYLDVQGVGVPGFGDGVTEIFRPYPNSLQASRPRGFWYTPIIR